jgi:hypothetical protein
MSAVRLPRMAAEVERRLLVNYRVDPSHLAGLLPTGMRPQLVDGAAVAGICLIRLGDLRPQGFPRAVGLTMENAAHRIAVEWEEPGGPRCGVYIPRRDTASRLAVLLGGRVFPGAHQHARFDVEETEQRLRVAFRASDDSVDVDVTVQVEPSLEGSGLFADVGTASAFFERGAVGLSPGRDGVRLEAVQLNTAAWRVEPCRVLSARSSWFEDSSRFPTGSVVLDSALVMRKVPVVWESVAA